MYCIMYYSDNNHSLQNIQSKRENSYHYVKQIILFYNAFLQQTHINGLKGFFTCILQFSY